MNNEERKDEINNVKCIINEMMQNIEKLPDFAKFQSINQYDMISILFLFQKIVSFVEET